MHERNHRKGAKTERMQKTCRDQRWPYSKDVDEIIRVTGRFLTRLALCPIYPDVSGHRGQRGKVTEEGITIEATRTSATYSRSSGYK